VPESETRQLIIFRVGPESFVLDIQPMVQIISYRSPTPVPRAPSFIEGIIVLRNQVVPVLNLQSRLFPDETVRDPRPKILIVRIQGQVVGFKVESVHRIIMVEEKDILPPPPKLAGLDVSFLKGVVHVNDDVFLYLDINRMLSPEEMDLLKKSRALTPKGGAHVSAS